MKTIRIDTNNQIAVLDIPSVSSLSDGGLLGDSPEHVLPRRLPRPYSMFVDECGLINDLPVNPISSYLYETDKHSSPIVGDIYLFKDGWGPDGFDSLGLSEEDISTLLPWLQDMAGRVAIAAQQGGLKC